MLHSLACRAQWIDDIILGKTALFVYVSFFSPLPANIIIIYFIYLFLVCEQVAILWVILSLFEESIIIS